MKKIFSTILLGVTFSTFAQTINFESGNVLTRDMGADSLSRYKIVNTDSNGLAGFKATLPTDTFTMVLSKDTTYLRTTNVWSFNPGLPGSGTLTGANNGLSVTGGTTVVMGGTLTQSTVISTDTFDIAYSGIDPVNGDTNIVGINSSESALSSLSANNGIITSFGVKSQEVVGNHRYPGNVTVQMKVDSNAALSRENATDVAIVAAFFEAGTGQAAEIIYQKKLGAGITRDVTQGYWNKHNLELAAYAWVDSMLYSNIFMDSLRIQLRTSPDTTGEFSYIDINNEDANHLIHIYSGDAGGTDSSEILVSSGFIYSSSVSGNDSTIVVHNDTSYRVIVYDDGTTNNAIITDESGHKINLTTGNLELTTTTGAFITARMTAAQAGALTPAAGMLIYVTDTDVTFTSIGFWGYENGAWVKL